MLLLCFEHVKELYANDHDFSVEYQTCEKSIIGKYFRHDGYLFQRIGFVCLIIL